MKAPSGKAIVQFLPYRREGQIEIPDRYKPESCEAVVVDDSSGETKPGEKVIVSTMDGTYFEQGDVRYCTVKCESLFIRFTEDGNGRIATMEPLGKRVITTDEQAKDEVSGFHVPDAYRKPENNGIVLAIGKCRQEFNVGDKVYFEQKRAVQLKIDGKKAMLVPEKLIIGFTKMKEAA